MHTQAPHHAHHPDEPAPVMTVRRFVTGFVALMMSVYAIFIAHQFNSRYTTPHDFHDKIDSPILAAELSKTAKDLEGVLHTERPAEARPDSEPGIIVAALRSNTYQDFLFILLYNLFLWSFAALFAGTDEGRRTIHRSIMLALVILIAISDCLENRGILSALNASLLTDKLASTISLASLCKWGLFALALLLTGWILVRSEITVYSLPTRRLFALAYGAAGFLMLVGLTAPHVIELASELFALLVAVNIFGLLGPFVELWFLRPNPPRYVEDFCSRRAQKQVDVAVYPQNP